MDFLALKNISEQTMELVNPTSPDKILRAGQILGLAPGQRVIDFGTGFGEVLALWAQTYGIGGVGIDVRPYACERAERKMAALGLADRIAIACGDAAEYAFEPGAFDVAAAIGSTFIWGDYRGALRAMGRAVRPGGALILGEPYWLTAAVPPEFARREPGILTEAELLRVTRDEGYDLGYVIRSSHDDWDRYESDNWQGLLRWLRDNPAHPDRPEVLRHLRESQEEYFDYGRRYFGWALFIVYPAQS